MMKAHVQRFALLLAAVLIGSPPDSAGQTWQTIFSGLPNIQGRAILVDPFSIEPAPNRIFLGNSYDLNGIVILDRSNGSLTFTRTTNYANFSDLGFDSFSQTLYATGDDGWQVRKSVDRGASWQVVESGSGVVAKSFATDNAGNIFICGLTNYENGTNLATSAVRKSSDQGHTWTTVAHFTNTSQTRMHFVPGTNGGLFVLATQAALPYWLVHRSRDKGVTWETVDAPASGHIPYALTSDSSGTIYVAGTFGNGSASDSSVIRSSTDGGDTWQTIHANPTLPGGGAMGVAAMAVDPLNRLFLAGTAVNSAGTLVWIVHWRNFNGEWSTHLPYGTASVISRAFGIATDRAGNVYVTGTTRASGVFTVMVQQLPAPKLKAARSGGSLVITWPSWFSGAVLESKDGLISGSEWVPAGTTPGVMGDQNVVTMEMDKPSSLYRLRKD
jgi:hypothetical protein